MRTTILISFVLLFTLSLNAQYPGGGGKGSQGAPSIGHIYGKLMDSLGKPIDQASVLVLQSKFDSSTKKKKDILLKGSNTDGKGEFNFEDLPLFAPLKLKVSAVGFKNFEQSVVVLPGSSDKDLGNIKLDADVNHLETVTVTTTSSALKMDIDKKTFNVDKNITSAGGTAVDVMKNVPSVQIDIDGNVKLRNATPQIYIDGRPTTLTLDQIPADAIESVEVITNPSAKFDASGGNAGILNIILKKNKKTGYNGNLNVGVDSRGGYNSGGNFSVRQGKINLSAAVNDNYRKDRSVGTLTQNNFLTGVTANNVQSSVSKNNGNFVFGRLGLDYYITNRTTFSIGGVKVHGHFENNNISNTNTDSVYTDHMVNSSSERTTNGSRTFDANGLQLGMIENFIKQGHQLTADANYFSVHNSGNNVYNSNNYDSNHNFIGNLVQQQPSSGANQFLTIQTDYTNPLTKTTKLEAGLRAQINKQSNVENLYNVEGGDLKETPGSSIQYHNTNNVYAAYTTVTSTIKNFGYEVGLRAESSNYSGVLNDTGHFTNNYPLSLFPSVFLSQKLGNKQELQLNFSRRINRPNFFQLIPFTDRSDTLSITRGNPNLVPEFTNSFEFSYSKTFKHNNSFLASAYYKHTNNLITSFTDTEYNAAIDKAEFIKTYVNANSSYSYGLELTSVNYVNKWYDFNLNVNLYNSKINTDNLNFQSQDAILSWFAKMNNNIKLPANFTIQLSGNYQSKTNLPISSGQRGFGPPSQAQSSSQGYIKPFWSVDAAVKKTFLKNQAASVSVSMSDIFRSRTSEQISTSNLFYQDYYRLNNPQLVRVNFSYRFGKMDASLFKRQNKNQNSGMQDVIQ